MSSNRRALIRGRLVANQSYYAEGLILLRSVISEAEYYIARKIETLLCQNLLVWHISHTKVRTQIIIIIINDI